MGCGVATGLGNWYRTRTRGTRVAKTVGEPIPVTNASCVCLLTCTSHSIYTAATSAATSYNTTNSPQRHCRFYHCCLPMHVTI
jgi:hypothetical protein